MAQTVSGGSYLGTDGKLHNANGKPLEPVEVVEETTEDDKSKKKPDKSKKKPDKSKKAE